MAEDADSRPSSKVARLLEEYDIEGLGAELEARWTADGDQRMSLRDLADSFNKRLLEVQLRVAGLDALEQDVQRTYRNLTGEDVTVGVQTDTRTRLEQNGIDVEEMERDFVTYQAIRSYLTEFRDAAYEGPADEEKIQADQETIQRLASRTLSVTEDRLQTLRETDRLDVGEFEVLLDLQVVCQSCGTQYSVDQLLEEGGCDCQGEREHAR